jgi:ribonuclease HII
MAVVDPTFDVEQHLLRGAPFVIGCDEVGRGALAGPVAVGLALVDSFVGSIPDGLRDSKLLSESRRERLAPLAMSWTLWNAVGLASSQEIDQLGIMACLGLAARRALTVLHNAKAPVARSVVLLDGHTDWLSPALASPLRVVTRVKGDRDCASVAAASVIAKVHRDRLLIERDLVTPGYDWARNKGYGSAQHRAAIAKLGPSDFHRHSWLRSSFGSAHKIG